MSIWSSLVRRLVGAGNEPARTSDFHPGKEKDNEIHGAGQGEQGFRGGRVTGQKEPDRGGNVQRGAGESRRASRGRGGPREHQGRAGAVPRAEAPGDRRGVAGGEGGWCGVSA